MQNINFVLKEFEKIIFNSGKRPKMALLKVGGSVYTYFHALVVDRAILHSKGTVLVKRVLNNYHSYLQGAPKGKIIGNSKILSYCVHTLLKSL